MNDGGGKCVLWEKRLSLSQKGNRFTRVSDEGFSVAQKCFVSNNTAHCNQWALNNFESWRSQVAVEESFPRNVLIIIEWWSKTILCFFLRKYVSNTAHCNKWALNDFGCSGGFRKFERGVHRGQLNKHGITTPINYNVHLPMSIRALSLAHVLLVHFAVH